MKIPKINLKSKLNSFYWNHKGLITIVVSFVLILNFVTYLKTNFYKKNPIDQFPSGIQIEDFEVYMESQKDIPSDIEGYSVYDKYAMGLQRQDGSDSDYDGLTDKEEIEIYGTDPLKASTAGDLYLDSYKVVNNMDPFKTYDYQEPQVYKYNECPEVFITAKVPTDFNTVVSDCTERYPRLSKYGLKSYEKGYEIYNCSGDVSIDVGEYIYPSNKIEVYIAEGPFLIEGFNNFNKCKFERDGSTVKIDYEFDNKESYFVYITEKQKISFNGIIDDFYNPDDKEDFENISGADQAEAFIYGCPILNAFGVPIHIDYTKCKYEDNTNTFLDAVGTYADKKVLGGKKAYKHKFNEINERAMEIKKGFFDMYLNAFEFIPGDKNNRLWTFLFYYSSYKDGYDNPVDKTNPYYKKVDTGFDKNIDELPFQNFESCIGEGGNCAGISHLTAYLFNKKQLPTEGSYNCFVNGKVEAVAWNIANDEDNATLLDPGLNDYKTKDFVNDNSDKSNNYIGAKLSDSEKQFVNMVGCFWQEGNDRADLEDLKLTPDQKYSVDIINKATKAIDEGKVLDVYMSMRTGMGHAVNVYGYEWLDQNRLRFMVYDSNIPHDKRRGFKLNETTCYLYVYVHKNLEEKDLIDYIYWPISDNFDYIATSHHMFTDNYELIFMDENWTVLR